MDFGSPDPDDRGPWDEGCLDDVLPAVYQELREVARKAMARDMHAQTIQPTALVHEAYLRLRQAGLTDWSDRSRVLAAAVRSMRNVLVDRARRRMRVKHGGGRRRIAIDLDQVGAVPLSLDLDEIEAALDEFETRDPRAAQVLSLRFFGDLTIEQVAQATGLSVATVNRDWRFARAWLGTRLAPGALAGESESAESPRDDA